MIISTHHTLQATNNVEDFNRSTHLLGATTLRNVLGTKCLSEILSERSVIYLISIQKYSCFQVYNIHDVLFKGADRPMDGGHPGPRHRPVGCEGRESGNVRRASGIVHYLGPGILMGAPERDSLPWIHVEVDEVKRVLVNDLFCVYCKTPYLLSGAPLSLPAWTRSP